MTPTNQVPEFKSQPWVMFDTIAARSFLVGDDRDGFRAFNTAGPAISQRGEMIFFATSRTRAQCPWYTNFDVQGQLAYGFEVWQVFIKIGIPVFPPTVDLQPVAGVYIPTATVGNLSPPLALAAAIVEFGVLDLDLGQEEQLSFPVHRFGAGGGLYSGSAFISTGQNSRPINANVLALPEPIEMPRTQNLSAVIRLAPEVLPIIGFPVVGQEGVGNPLPQVTVDSTSLGLTNNVPYLPYSVQVGLIGRRIKKTQYGQLPAGERG